MSIEFEGLNDTEFAVLKRRVAAQMSLCSTLQMLAVADLVRDAIRARQHLGSNIRPTEQNSADEVREDLNRRRSSAAWSEQQDFK